MSPRRTSPPQDPARSSSPYGVQTRQGSTSASNKAPKKREQFSACGACRMRRVRCDLKDLPASSQQAGCSNCRERGLKCVDEFAEVKAVKLLRRGRRLQQAEAVYGKAANEDSIRSTTPPPSVIPRLAPEFFDSAFFARLQIQLPILEPLEFRERYWRFCGGDTEALEAPGQLIAMTLVVWAATFGVNEAGVEDADHDAPDQLSRRKLIEDMLQELLYLIDLHSILRTVSWDGVRLLLLLLPLTQEIQRPMDRLVMYEATLSQAYNICGLTPRATINTGQGEYIDALARARLFWYAHITDGVTSGLRGGRILLTDYDLSTFEETLPGRADGSRASDIYWFTSQCISIPGRISSVCRTINAALTGPMARRTDRVKEDVLKKAWAGLAKCWTDLDSLRSADPGGIIDRENLHRFVHGWQIFIFECHNRIRESLRQRLVPASAIVPQVVESPGDTGHALQQVYALHEQSIALCHSVALDVLNIIKENLGTTFFQYDASLVRDGCFFAAIILADKFGASEEVEACIRAMNEMRWLFSKSKERIDTVRMICQHPRGQQMHLPTGSLFSSLPDPQSRIPAGEDAQTFARRQASRSLTIPPLTIPDHSSSRSSSAPSTSVTGDSSWPSTSSSSRPHSQSTSMYGTSPIASRTSSYAGSPQVTGSLQHASSSKNPMTASPSLMLGPAMASGLSFDQVEEPYYNPYPYATNLAGSSSQVSLIHQPVSSVPALLPVYQMPYEDGVMHFSSAPLAPSPEDMLSPAEGDEDAGLVGPSHFLQQ
ncbi:hypothetical protein BDW22DRAFT_1358742 [Trametopsis cervina]|nr:hypothetical protein BDW22DRAFT_1358742 [Trametopsis cervina]